MSDFIGEPVFMNSTSKRVVPVMLSGALAAATAMTLFTTPAQATTPTASPTASEQPSIDIKSSKVFVVGDSLTVGAAPYLRRNLGPKVRRLNVDAQVGRFTGPGIAKLRTNRARSAHVWVVALGTNDGPSPTQARSNVRKVMRLAGEREVIWVNVVRPGGYGKVNRVLRQYDAKKENLTVLDWAAVIRSRSSLLTGDRVHLTSYGYKIRAKLTKRAVVALGRD